MVWLPDRLRACLCEICMFSQWLHGSSLGTLVLSHSLKTYMPRPTGDLKFLNPIYECATLQRVTHSRCFPCLYPMWTGSRLCDKIMEGWTDAVTWLVQLNGSNPIQTWHWPYGKTKLSDAIWAEMIIEQIACLHSHLTLQLLKVNFTTRCHIVQIWISIANSLWNIDQSRNWKKGSAQNRSMTSPSAPSAPRTAPWIYQ